MYKKKECPLGVYKIYIYILYMSIICMCMYVYISQWGHGVLNMNEIWDHFAGFWARPGFPSLTEVFQCDSPLMIGFGEWSVDWWADGTCPVGLEEKSLNRSGVQMRIQRSGWNFWSSWNVTEPSLTYLSPLTSVPRVWLSLAVLKLLYEIEQNHMNRFTE